MVSDREGTGVVVACGPVAAMARHDLLSEAEAARAITFPPARAAEFAAGRALLRWTLAHHFGGAAGDWGIGVAPQGGPVLLGLPSTGVSISHSGGGVAVAVGAGRAVGVDIQGPVTPTPGLLRRCCSPAQRQEMAALPAHRQAAAMARRWTVHEACAKATGRGLPRRGEPGPGPLFARSGRWRGYAWHVLPHHGPGSVAVAFDGPPDGAAIRHLLVDDLDRGPTVLPCP
ncbi:4-phosphopantetheinyl transferase [Streptomyces albidoflavus]|nr:4-phosphopantetheinyl transferase [Streptomyces albidoflavus]RZE03335.1 4-phosphopantetheinyl transferase [Streptomyces albidoflavus]RZE11808.1 4-phosphopantetheinyl transferase [Streptomyces albidoflavus]